MNHYTSRGIDFVYFQKLFPTATAIWKFNQISLSNWGVRTPLPNSWIDIFCSYPIFSISSLGKNSPILGNSCCYPLRNQIQGGNLLSHLFNFCPWEKLPISWMVILVAIPLGTKYREEIYYPTFSISALEKSPLPNSWIVILVAIPLGTKYRDEIYYSMVAMLPRLGKNLAPRAYFQQHRKQRLNWDTDSC